MDCETTNTKKLIKTPILLYDDNCTLCTRFKQSLERLSGAEQITFVSIHDNEIYEKLPEISKDECQKELHFIDRNNNIFKGANAILELKKEFPLVEKFAWLIESGMGEKAINYFYKMANKYREMALKECHNCK